MYKILVFKPYGRLLFSYVQPSATKCIKADPALHHGFLQRMPKTSYFTWFLATYVKSVPGVGVGVRVNPLPERF